MTSIKKDRLADQPIAPVKILHGQKQSTNIKPLTSPEEFASMAMAIGKLENKEVRPEDPGKPAARVSSLESLRGKAGKPAFRKVVGESSREPEEQLATVARFPDGGKKDRQ